MRSALRVVIAGTRGIPARYGGFETYAEKLGVHLAALGHEVSVICPGSKASAPELPTSSYGVKRIFIPDVERFGVGRYSKAALTILSDFLAVMAAISSRSDIILLCGYASGPVMYIPSIFRAKLIVNPDGFEWNSARWGPIARSWLIFCERIAARAASALIADAKPIAVHFAEKYSVRARVIPYGAPIVDPPIPLPDSLKSAQFFLIIARMVPETSIPLLIKGYVNSDVDADLLILGPVTDDKFYNKEVAPLCRGRVKHLGAIYDQRFVQSLRGNCLALLHGHASEGTNPSLVESLACGSVIYAINTDSNREVLGEGDFYFDDVVSLSNKLNQCAEMTDRQRLMRRSYNLERAKSLFSWEKAALEHERVFREALMK